MANDKTIIDTALERYKIAVDGWQDIYREALDDLRFVYDVDGGQWSEDVKRDRKNRPMLTNNKLQKFVRQLRGDMRINKPSIRVIPVDDKADVDRAEIYNALIRQIQYQSNAEIAYDTAYTHALAGSIGYFRILTEYEDDNSFNQCIKINRLPNPFAVHLDPAASEFNLEDARYGFIEDTLPKETFEKMYPKAELIDFDSNSQGQQYKLWFEKDRVKIAEYFWKEPTTKTIVQLSDGRVVEWDKSLKEWLDFNNLQVIKEREVQSHKVMWCKMSGKEMLEDKQEWIGKHIPVIPVFGDEIVVNGKRYILSLIRGAKDPQRMYNYLATSAIETVALTPKTPFILDHRQLKGYENEWAEANLKNAPYLRYNAVGNLGKPSREPQAQIPAGIMSLMQSTAFDLEDHLGRYEASKGAASNERSGLAIEKRAAQSERGSVTFIDNFSRALTYAGRQLLDLIPKVYDTPRALVIMGEDNEMKNIPVNMPIVDEMGQTMGIGNDLTVGKYDLVVTIAPTYSTKRKEAAEMLIQAMQYAPMVAPIIAPFLFKYADWEGSREIAAKLEQMANMQAGGGQPPAPPPPPTQGGMPL